MSDATDLMGLGMPVGLAQKVVQIASGAQSDIDVDDLSVSQTVKNVLNAADMAGVQTQMGGTSTGKLLFTAATPADALSAIGAIDKTVAPGATARGGVFQQTAIANIAAAPSQADFNGLLAKLRTSGLLAP